MKINKNISQNLKAIALGVVIAATASYAFAWNGPGNATPPNGNVSAPLNVSTSTQTKYGNLVLNGLSVSAATILSGVLQIPIGTPVAGQVLTAQDASGTVGWASAGGSSAQSCGSNVEFITGFTASGTIICNFANPMATIAVTSDEQAVVVLTGTSVTITNTTSGGASLVSTQFADTTNGMPKDGRTLKVSSLTSTNPGAAIISNCPSGANPANSSAGNPPSGMSNNICIYQQPTASNSYQTKVWLWDGGNGSHTWTFTLGYSS